jgi:hypothetical protein
MLARLVRRIGETARDSQGGAWHIICSAELETVKCLA